MNFQTIKVKKCTRYLINIISEVEKFLKKVESMGMESHKEYKTSLAKQLRADYE